MPLSLPFVAQEDTKLFIHSWGLGVQLSLLSVYLTLTLEPQFQYLGREAGRAEI